MQRSSRQAAASVTAVLIMAALVLLTPPPVRAMGPGSTEGSGTLALGGHQLEVSGRLGVGWLSGESTETVYDTRTGRKLSELVWDLDSVFLLNAGASIEPTPWLRLNADLWFRMNDGSGSMDDYDYVLPGYGFTHWSHSEVDLSEGYIVDVNAAFAFHRRGDTVFSALAGLIGGLIAIRSKGVYFALISFGLAQVVSKFVYNTRELGASDGIIGVPAASLAPGVTSGTPEVFFLLVLSFIGALYLGMRYLMNTPMGRQLDAIRINEHRVSFLGVDAWRYKLGAFVAAACIAGLSGALYPMLRGFVSPELMFFQVSGNAVINVIVGGTGTLIGPLYGSAILTGLRSVVGSFTAHHHIVIGVMFVVVVIVMPRGLIGYTTPLLQRWLDRRQAPR